MSWDWRCWNEPLEAFSSSSVHVELICRLQLSSSLVTTQAYSSHCIRSLSDVKLNMMIFFIYHFRSNVFPPVAKLSNIMKINFKFWDSLISLERVKIQTSNFPCGLKVRNTKATRNSSGDEIANVNFLYDDIVHVLQNTINSCINSATDRRGGYVLERTDDRQTDGRTTTYSER